MEIIVLLFALSALIIGVMGVFYTRYKSRLVWAVLEDWQHKYNLQQRQIIELKKAQILNQVKSLRLPPLMPSQHGEDVLLAQFFEFKRSGYFVEVGAFDGVELSNSYFFEALGWDGCLIEPNPHFFKAYAAKRPYSVHVNAAVLAGQQNVTQFTTVLDEPALSYSKTSLAHKSRVKKVDSKIELIEVACVKLSEVLREIKQPIDFISIDVEGAELSVLQTLDFKQNSPSVFIIEDNSGGSDKSVSDFLSNNGFEKRYQLGCNDFYLAKDDPREFNLSFQ